MEKKRSSFTGRVGFVLAAAGSAVGLGNLWRFPYLAAKYGGGIFLLVYIILAILKLPSAERPGFPASAHIRSLTSVSASWAGCPHSCLLL